MGETGGPAVPALANREWEMSRIREALEAAATAEARLLLVSGEAGIGKTRLVQEAAAEATRRGRTVVFGAARAEANAPYHAWAEPLEQLGIGYVLEEATPPRLLGLYVSTRGGRLLVKIERKEDGESGPEIDDTLLQPKPIDKSAALLGGGLSTFDRDNLRLLVMERGDFRLCAVMRGHEDEGLVADLRLVMGAVDLDVTGADSEAARLLQEMLDSGKYEGVDYGRNDPKLRQSRLFQHTALGLVRKAELRPLVIVLDDLQWADPSSLALLRYVARNMRGSNALLLGTYRTEDGSVRPHLRDQLDRMSKEDLVVEINLGGLSRQELGFLAKSFIGPHGLPEPFLDLLWQETQGNPLLVREVLRGLEEEKAIQPQGATKKLISNVGELSIPHKVREAVRARLERVPREDRRLLEAAATCGTRFTTAMVARLVGEAEGKVLNGFGAIAGVHGFLREGESGFVFDHPIVQEVLYEDMAEDVRRVYHREAADWLELAGGPTEDVALHLYRARDHRAPERLRRAGEIASAQFANAEAIRHYDEALELETDPGRRSEILSSLGFVYDVIGELDKARESYERALAGAVGERKAMLLAQVAKGYGRKGDLEQSMKRALEALSLVTGSENKAEARALNELGHTERDRGNFARSLEHFAEALRIFEKIGDHGGVAASSNGIGLVYADRGEYDAAVEYFAKYLHLMESAGDWWHIGAALQNLGTISGARGDLAAALEQFERALAISKKIGDQAGIATALTNIGEVFSYVGDYDAALKNYTKALQVSESIGDMTGAVFSLNGIGIVYGKRGDHAAAVEHLTRALRIQEKIGNQHGIAFSLRNLGVVYRDLGDYDVALALLEKSITISGDIGARFDEGLSRCELADLEIKRGKYERAEDLCNQALSLSTAIGAREIIAASRRVLGAIFCVRKMWRESIENFEESVRVFHAIGHRHGRAMSHYEFGLMWKERGDASKARDHFAIAAGIFKDLKLDEEIRKVDEARRGLP